MYKPTSRQQHLSIHLYRWLATKLSASEVRIMWGVDVVVAEWLFHVLVYVKPVQKHWSILIRHQISTEAINWHFLWYFTTQNTITHHFISSFLVGEWIVTPVMQLCHFVPSALLPLSAGKSASRCCAYFVIRRCVGGVCLCRDVSDIDKVFGEI